MESKRRMGVVSSPSSPRLQDPLKPLNRYGVLTPITQRIILNTTITLGVRLPVVPSAGPVS